MADQYEKFYREWKSLPEEYKQKEEDLVKKSRKMTNFMSFLQGMNATTAIVQSAMIAKKLSNGDNIDLRDVIVIGGSAAAIAVEQAIKEAYNRDAAQDQFIRTSYAVQEGYKAGIQRSIKVVKDKMNTEG